MGKLYSPLAFSVGDFKRNATGPDTDLFFLAGNPITVNPAPLGLPRFTIFFGSFTTFMVVTSCSGAPDAGRDVD